MQPPMKVQTVSARLRDRIATARSWVEHTIFWKAWERLLENEFIDRSVAVGAKAFVSLFPALIVVAAFMPASVRASIITTITRRAGVSGEGLTTVKGAFASSDDVKKATGILGLLLTFFYINTFVTALQRVYTKAWRRPRVGRISGYAIAAAWLIGLMAYFGLIGSTRALFGNGPQTIVFALLAWLSTVALWSLTPWFLLQRQVRLRVLVATGALTGTGMAAYAATASLWMPNMVNQNQHQFGFFGVALALVTWLTGAATIVVVSACIGPVLAEDTGALGRLTRGRALGPALAADALPSLPPPMYAPRLSGAIGIRRQGDDREPVDLSDDHARAAPTIAPERDRE